jgi:hypothetical protein
MVLFASPQVGKTGACISFLQQLELGIVHSSLHEYFQRPDDEDDAFTSSESILDEGEFELPYWENCNLANFPRYSHMVCLLCNNF